jgi:hypothetical protein
MASHDASGRIHTGKVTPAPTVTPIKKKNTPTIPTTSATGGSSTNIANGLTAGLGGTTISFAPTLTNSPDTQVTVAQVDVPVYNIVPPIPNVAFLSTNSTMQSTFSPTSSTGYAPPGAGTSLSFPFNPNSLNFNYILNKQSFDTYGGRVTQLLSVKIDSLNVQGDAGSRGNLLSFFNGIKNLQENQIQTQSSILFTIPNSGSDLAKTMLGQDSSGVGTSLSFYVWIRSIDIGWDPTSVTYPYSLSFEVEDISYPGYAPDPTNLVGGYGSLISFIANTALEKLFINSAGANEVGFGAGTTNGTTNFSAYYAGLAPSPVPSPVGGTGAYTNAGGNNATDLTQLTNLGANPITL